MSPALSRTRHQRTAGTRSRPPPRSVDTCSTCAPSARPVVLYRTEAGTAVALEDRCAHRAFPLSAGTLDGDLVRCGLCGFGYDTDGQCVSVPTQPRVPLGAHVAAYPVQERDGLVWVWLGRVRSCAAASGARPALARRTTAWAGVGGTVEVAAGFLLLHENFADVTQVPFVAPEIAPAVLARPRPHRWRSWSPRPRWSCAGSSPAAPLPGWQTEMLGADVGDATTVQGGFFVSPAVWTDHWDATYDGGSARLRFTQLVTPVDARLSRLHWRVSRDFALVDQDADARMDAIVPGLLRTGADRDGDRPARARRGRSRAPRSTSPPTSPPCASARSCVDMLAEEGIASARPDHPST